MATRIKQGDAYSLPVDIWLNGEPISIADVSEVEFVFGDGLRKLYPGDVPYSTADAVFYLPLTQDETFAFPADSAITLDIRVKFNGGNVIGIQRMIGVSVADATSEVVL